MAFRNCKTIHFESKIYSSVETWFERSFKRAFLKSASEEWMEPLFTLQTPTRFLRKEIKERCRRYRGGYTVYSLYSMPPPSHTITTRCTFYREKYTIEISSTLLKRKAIYFFTANRIVCTILRCSFASN